MALLSCIYDSAVLGCKTAMNVILPEASAEDPRPVHELPVFTLLHGMDGTYLSWCANTRIEDLAAKHRIAVVMPDAKNSFYCDTPAGERYYTQVTQEVPAAAQRFFGLSDAREKNHIAGISMGGFGAVKLALTHPERYATVGSLSGALDMAAQIRNNTDVDDLKRAIIEDAFGREPRIENTENDLPWLLGQAAAQGKLPPIYQYCGTEDFLYQDNRRFLATAHALGVSVTYTETPGDHRWPYWAEQIGSYIPWALANVK